MTSRHISRKEIKQQDRFASWATHAARWAMERRRRIGLVVLVVVAVISGVIGIVNYRARQEQRAAGLLAAALDIYQSPIATVDPGLVVAEPAVDPVAEGTGDATAAAGSTEATSGSVPAGADEHSSAGHRHFESEEARLQASVEALRPIVEEYGAYPSGQAAKYYLGIALADLGEVEEAAETLGDAAGASVPMVGSMARYRLALLFAAEQRHDEALAELDRLVRDPRGGFPVAEALLAMAREYEAAGDRQAAMLTYERIADEHGTSVYAIEARNRADQLAAELGVDLDVETP